MLTHNRQQPSIQIYKLSLTGSDGKFDYGGKTAQILICQISQYFSLEPILHLHIPYVFRCSWFQSDQGPLPARCIPLKQSICHCHRIGEREVETSSHTEKSGTNPALAIKAQSSAAVRSTFRSAGTLKIVRLTLQRSRDSNIWSGGC